MGSRDYAIERFADLLAEPLRNGVYKSKEHHGRGVKIVNMGELFGNPRLRNVPMKRLELTDAELRRSSLQKGDLLFARRSLVAEGAGKCSLVKEVCEPTTFESSIIRARPDPTRVDSDFLYYYFASPRGRNSMRTILRQVAVSGITGSDLAELPIPVPPLSAQRECADVLELFDDRIDLLRETNSILESAAQALFKSWFIDFDPVRAKAEGRDPDGINTSTAALFPAEFEESALGLVPKGWRVTKLGDFLELTKGCSYKGEGLAEADGAHMFNLGCFNAQRVFASEKVKRYTGEYRPRHAVLPGDLIIANTDMTQARDILGRPAFVPGGFEPGFISHHVFKVTIRASEPQMADALRLFVFFALQQETFRERAVGFATGTTVLALPAAAVTECPSCIPPDSALFAFSGIARPLLEQIRLNEKRADTLMQVRDELLPRLISGKLRLVQAERQIEEALA